MIIEEIHLLPGSILIRGRMFPEGREPCYEFSFPNPYTATLYKYYKDMLLIGTM